MNIKENKIKELLSDLTKKNPVAFVAVCIACVSLVVAIISLVLLGVESHNVLRFMPDGNGDYIVSVGDGKHLSEIKIPKTYKFGKVVGIDDEGFAECESLTKITIPNSVEFIGDNAFEYCASLEEVNLGGGIKSIGASAFYNCTSLKKIVIPEGVTEIGDHAFARCESLTNISIPNSVKYVGTTIFHESEYVVLNEYENAYYLGNSENPYHLLVSARSTDITSCDIHPSTRVIASKAFSYCTMITEIDIPEGVTHIGTEAFYEAVSLYEIIIPKSLSLISDRAFYNCSSLSYVYYTGPEADAYQIQLGMSNDPFTSAMIYCQYTR